jgi:hypothetical protein
VSRYYYCYGSDMLYCNCSSSVCNNSAYFVFNSCIFGYVPRSKKAGLLIYRGTPRKVRGRTSRKNKLLPHLSRGVPLPRGLTVYRRYNNTEGQSDPRCVRCSTLHDSSANVTRPTPIARTETKKRSCSGPTIKHSASKKETN